MLIITHSCLLLAQASNCIKWRQTEKCNIGSQRNPLNDQECDQKLGYAWSGFCECSNGIVYEKSCSKLPTFPSCQAACFANGKVDIP